MSDASLAALSATEAAAELARGAISAEDYTRACLDRIAALEDEVHAFIHLDPDYALSQARALDERRRNGQPIGPLHGVPVGIKDIFDTADYPTECGSPLLKGRRPVRDCTAVARLRAAGAVIIGKTVTTEFAYFHPGRRAIRTISTRTPGGSSSGSAAAVAAGMVPLAIGSQTNGSVIRPASFCGVYGVKPTHGTISRHGALILSQTLDHVGVFARTLADMRAHPRRARRLRRRGPRQPAIGVAWPSARRWPKSRRSPPRSPSCARRFGTRPMPKRARHSKLLRNGWAMR